MAKNKTLSITQEAFKQLTRQVVKEAREELVKELIGDKVIRLDANQRADLVKDVAKHIKVEIDYNKIPKAKDGKDGENLVWDGATRADVINGVKSLIPTPKDGENYILTTQDRADIAEQTVRLLPEQKPQEAGLEAIISETARQDIIDEVISQAPFVSRIAFQRRLEEIKTLIDQVKAKKPMNAGISGQDMIDEINKILGSDWQTSAGGDMLKSVYDTNDNEEIDSDKFDDSGLVHLSEAETISGLKVFTALLTVNFSGGAGGLLVTNSATDTPAEVKISHATSVNRWVKLNSGHNTSPVPNMTFGPDVTKFQINKEIEIAATQPTHTSLTITNNGLNIGKLLRLYSNSLNASGRNLSEIINDNPAAINTTPSFIQQDAFISGVFKKYQSWDGLIFYVSDGTTPDGNLSALLGHICYNGPLGAIFICDGGDGWTVVGGGGVSIVKGQIDGIVAKYNTTTSITITSGAVEGNGKAYNLASDTTHTMTSLVVGFDFHYIYIDDSVSVAPTPAFIDSTTEPVFSESLRGWYNGDDRCVGVVHGSSAASTVASFESVALSGNYIRMSFSGRIVTEMTLGFNMNPSGFYQTPNNRESSVVCPVNATELYVNITNTDSLSLVQLYLSTLEHATRETNITSAQIVNLSYDRGDLMGWLVLGVSRNIRIAGVTNDDNSLTSRIYGYGFQR